MIGLIYMKPDYEILPHSLPPISEYFPRLAQSDSLRFSGYARAAFTAGLRVI